MEKLVMEIKHICKKNTMYGCKVYGGNGRWWLSLEGGCCRTIIDFCPFCGVKLKENLKMGERKTRKGYRQFNIEVPVYIKDKVLQKYDS